jgi:prefoldin beta subunit
MTTDKDAKSSPQESLQKLQVIEQTLHAQSAQRNALQAQFLEVENATRELAQAKESWRIIGNIMVKSDTANLKTELEEKKESLQTRIAGLERQEKKLREEMQKLQNEILGA